MNIFNDLLIRLSQVITAVLISIGLMSQPAMPVNINQNPTTSAQSEIKPIVYHLPISQLKTYPPTGGKKVAVITQKKQNIVNLIPQVNIGQPEQQIETIIEYKTIFIPVPVYEYIQQPLPITQIPEIINQPNTNQMPQQKTLEIISPMSNKGLGRTYLARDEVLDEANYIELGLVIYDEGETYYDNLLVEVEATDESFNKTMNGTGNICKIYPNGAEKTVPYYPFSYEFKTAGEHTITFKYGELTQSVVLQVGEDTR